MWRRFDIPGRGMKGPDRVFSFMKGLSLFILVSAGYYCFSPPHLHASDLVAPACPDWIKQFSTYRTQTRIELLKRLNQIRVENRANELRADSKLDEIADAYAGILATEGKLSHVSPDGKDLVSRLHEKEYRTFDLAGENLAMNTTYRYKSFNKDGTLFTAVCFSPAELAGEILKGWMRSEGHRQNLLNKKFTHVGSGLALDRTGEQVYVVEIYVRRVTCGFKGGPCCLDPRQPAARLCQFPLHCEDDRCIER